jgi:xylan 1,4-beta-xylosidase
MAALMKGSRVATSSTLGMTAAAIVAAGVRDRPDIDAMATTEGRSAAVMLWNYHDMETPAPNLPVTVTVKGLPPNADRVRLTHYRIDNTHSNAYTVWKAMGSPQNPTLAEMAELKAKDGLQLLESPRWLTASNGGAEIATEMPRHAVSLLLLDW